MDFIQRLENVHMCLLENGLTIPMYIRGALLVPSSDSTLRENLLSHAGDICSDLSRHDTSESVFLWAFEIVNSKLCREVVSLTHQKMGLHFNASKTTAAQKIKENAPYLWTLVNALLDANPARRRASHAGPSETQTMEQLAAQTEGDLGEIGGEGELESEVEDEEDTSTAEAKAKKRRIRAASRNAALLLIVCRLPTI